MEKNEIITKFEVIIGNIVYEFDDLRSAEKKMRAYNRSELERNLLKKELKNEKVIQTYLLE